MSELRLHTSLLEALGIQTSSTARAEAIFLYFYSIFTGARQAALTESTQASSQVQARRVRAACELQHAALNRLAACAEALQTEVADVLNRCHTDWTQRGRLEHLRSDPQSVVYDDPLEVRQHALAACSYRAMAVS